MVKGANLVASIHLWIPGNLQSIIPYHGESGALPWWTFINLLLLVGTVMENLNQNPFLNPDAEVLPIGETSAVTTDVDMPTVEDAVRQAATAETTEPNTSQSEVEGSGRSTNPNQGVMLSGEGSSNTANLPDDLRHNASNINRLHLDRPKKASGGQRRKWAKQQAKLEGVPIRKRGKGKGNAPFTPTTLSSKRQRSEGNSPTTPESKAKEKKSRHDVSQPGPSGETHAASYSQAVTQLKMAVVLEAYPDAKLSDEMMKSLKTSLTKEIFKSKPEESPKFTNYYGEKGVLYITCADEASRQWLVNKISGDLKECIGTPLRTGPFKEIVRSTKMTMWVSAELVDLIGATDPKSVITLLRTQNPNLPIEDISVINSNVDKAGTTIVLHVGESALKVLKEMGFKAHLGLSQVTFKILGRRDSKPHGEGTANKPAA